MEQLLEKLRKIYPDEMVRKDLDAFERGRLLGQLEVVEQVERLIKRKQEEK